MSKMRLNIAVPSMAGRNSLGWVGGCIGSLTQPARAVPPDIGPAGRVILRESASMHSSTVFPPAVVDTAVRDFLGARGGERPWTMQRGVILELAFRVHVSFFPLWPAWCTVTFVADCAVQFLRTAAAATATGFLSADTAAHGRGGGVGFGRVEKDRVTMGRVLLSEVYALLNNRFFLATEGSWPGRLRESASEWVTRPTNELSSWPKSESLNTSGGK
jgi:hypothetical protein